MCEIFQPTNMPKHVTDSHVVPHATILMVQLSVIHINIHLDFQMKAE